MDPPRPRPPVYILGAGFSKAINAKMPLTDELGAAVLPDVQHLLTEGAAALVRTDNFESVLSIMSSPPPFASMATRASLAAAFTKLVELASYRLHHVQNEVFKDAPPPWLQSLVRRWVEEEAVVVSLNYDTLIEACVEFVRRENKEPGLPTVDNLTPNVIRPLMARTGLGVLGGDSRKTFRLLKLHGSLNWYASSLGAQPAGTVYYDVPRSGWVETEYAASHLATLRELRDGLDTYIVPPSWDKAGFLSTDALVTIWHRAAKAVALADSVTTIGYSLPPADTSVASMLRLPSSSSSWTHVNRRDVKGHYERIVGCDAASTFVGLDAVERYAAGAATEA